MAGDNSHQEKGLIYAKLKELDKKKKKRCWICAPDKIRTV
jgi:hypothetical protein